MESNSIKSYEQYLTELCSHSFISRDQERIMLYQYHTTDNIEVKKEIRDTLIKANIRFILKILYKSYITPQTPKDIVAAMVHESIIAFSIAIDKFNLEYDNKLITWAFHQIKGHLNKFHSDNFPLISMPRNLHRRLYKLNSIYQSYFEQGKTPTNEDLADKMNESVKTINKLKTCFYQYCSLDSPVSQNKNYSNFNNSLKNTTIKDILSDSRPCPDETYIRKEQYKALSDAFKRLSPDEQHILKLRFLSDNPLSRHQVKKQLGLTHLSMLQLENYALQKMRHYLSDEFAEKKFKQQELLKSL